MKIHNIFEEMMESYLCESAYEFSERYLGKSKGYYSVIKSNNLNPSISALAVLEESLIHRADEYENDSYEVFKTKRNHLLQLSNKVKDMRKQICYEKVLNNKKKSLIDKLEKYAI